MRWNNLSVAPAEPADVLPFSLPAAVMRTFDTPGFAGMTFYEIRARSLISRVPGASRVPFEYTINPYRGCSHACVYCQAGDTPILLADGRTRPLADLRVGDLVVGTAAGRFVPTPVLAHWSTTKPAYRVTLSNGTQLIASGDHRYLSDRGWRYVSGQAGTVGPRPALAPGMALFGTGRFVEPPKDSADYRWGYLTGAARGGRIGAPQAEASQRIRAIRADSGDRAWPPPWPDGEPSDEWCQGWLAGLFDAGGSGPDPVRIPAPDAEVLSWLQAALIRFRFHFRHLRPPAGRAAGPATVELRGGLAERLRFCLTTDPAVTANRVVTGATVRAREGLEVVAVTRLGVDVPMFDITTGTRDFVADGVVSHNCFARHTHAYLDLDTGHDFDTKVVVKVNAPELLRRELAAPTWRGAHIAMGTNVDCYQRAEGRYGLMRGIITALRDRANPFSILTKATLITRDLDLLTQAATVTDVGVSFSVGFLDEQTWRDVEPGTPSPRRRLEALRRFVDAGFRVHVLMAPILPGLTDTDESIDETVAAIADSGAAGVSPIVLHLRPGTREWYAQWLARSHPGLVERYRELYGRGSYAPKAYQREIGARVAIAARHHGVGRAAMTEHRAQPAGSPPTPSAAGRPSPPEPEQLTLL